MNEQTFSPNTESDDPVHELLREAWALQREGQYRKARRIYRRVLERNPDHADANNLLGLLWIQAGHPGDAIAPIERALKTEPDKSQSHLNLGVALQSIGRLPQARESFIRAIELQPDHVDAIFALGNANRIMGNLKDARRALQRLLEIEPDHIEALCSMGFVEIAQEKFAEAEKQFSEALARDPKHHASKAGYGEALMGQRRFAEAEQWLRKALNDGPASADMHNDLGATLNRLDQADQAVDQFKRALRIDPMHAQARINLGLTLEQLGHLEDAERAYRDTIRSAPGFADAHYHLAHLRTHRSSPDEIKAMKALFGHEAAPEPARIRLAFGLGHALESAGQYAEAFHYMSEAHRLRARTNPFSLETTVQNFSTLRTWFTRERIKSLGGSGVPDERPVLIVGLPRSGTALVEQILASHPQIFGAGETGLLGAAIANLSRQLEQPYPEGLDALPTRVIHEQAEQYLAGLEKRAGSAQRIADTTPMNFLQLGLAAAMFPDARFVHVRRDPMDQCLSIYRQTLGDAHSYSHDLHDLAHFYQLYEQHMEYWHETLPGRIHDVEYEQLVTNPKSEVRQLLEFIGMPNHPACLEFHKTQRLVRAPSASQVRQPLYDSAIGFWKNYADELEPMRQILRPGD